MSRTVAFALVSAFLTLTIGCADVVDAPRRGDTPLPPTAAGAKESAPPQPGRADADDPSQAATPPAPADDPGAPPSGACSIAKGQFVTRSSAQSSYVAYVPASYDGTPTRLLVALHGCGDDAQNFAEWAGAPYETRDDQTHIAISVDGASGGGGCWDMSRDAAKVLAAIDDVARCVYVHRQKVVVGGFSSGGMLAYSLGMKHSDRFAGILIENSALSSAGNPDSLLAGAAHKLPIAHVAHTSDGVFPIGRVRGDWSKISAAGFPLKTQELPGDHDGTTDDWAHRLIPQMAAWKRP